MKRVGEVRQSGLTQEPDFAPLFVGVGGSPSAMEGDLMEGYGDGILLVLGNVGPKK